MALIPALGAINPKDKALINLLLIIAILGIGLLVVIGLLIAWRNLINRQREMEAEHEMRDPGLPHADAWSTAAQRMNPPEVGPDEAHLSMQSDPGPDEDGPPFDDDSDEDDEFPFDRDDDFDDDDDEGPFDRA